MMPDNHTCICSLSKRQGWTALFHSLSIYNSLAYMDADCLLVHLVNNYPGVSFRDQQIISKSHAKYCVFFQGECLQFALNFQRGLDMPKLKYH